MYTTCEPSGEIAMFLPEGSVEGGAAADASANRSTRGAGVAAPRQGNTSAADTTPTATPTAAAPTIHHRRDRDATLTSGAERCSASVMSSFTSLMSRSLRAGSFSSNRRSTLASGLAAAGSARQSGSSLSTLASVSDTSSPPKGRRPVSIS